MTAPLHRHIGIGFVLVILLLSCAKKTRPPSTTIPSSGLRTQKPYQIKGVWYYPLPSAEGYVEEGLASWYGPEFHGKPTSCGEPYDMYAMTAAHKTLPLGTNVKVTNLRNGRTVILRVNDRGPLFPGGSSISPAGPPRNWDRQIPGWPRCGWKRCRWRPRSRLPATPTGKLIPCHRSVMVFLPFKSGLSAIRTTPIG